MKGNPDMNKLRISIVLAVFLFPILAFAQVRELPSPAGAGSGQPNLTVSPDGRAYLSWIERLGEGRFSLRFSTLEKDRWSAPRVIAEGSNWFVNWADFPSMVVLPDGSLAAHWLVKSGPGTFEYDVTISRSFDGGKTWGKPFVPHRDGVKAEHGFVSLFAAKDGALAAVWLNGREMKPDEGGHGHGRGSMTLRYVKIKRDGALVDEAALDARVCECCQTSAAMTADGPVVVYRDRSDHEKEIRDISIVRLKAGKWSAPRPVFEDGWQLNGCPVNGPAIAASGRRAAVAWFTGANNAPRVKLAFSDDAGESFGEPITVDDGSTVGRVDVLLLADGSAMVCWLEKAPGGGEVRVRRVRPDGKCDPSITIAPSGTARSNGFPQMARVGETLVFAWTGPRVLTATMPLPSQNSGVDAALAKYDQAFRGKDVATIRNLLADDVLLYEHSVRNVGLADVFDNHLKPEISEFEDMKAEFTDVRITPGGNMALVTRQYKIEGKMRGRDITAAGNETMVWKKVGSEWKIAHIHYSHPCPRPAAQPK